MKTSVTRSLCLAAIFAAFAMPGLAQVKRVPISIVYKGDDTVGQAFEYAVKEQLGRSAVFQYSTSDDVLVLNILAVDNFEQGNVNFDHVAAVSVVFTLSNKPTFDYLADHWVMAVGKDNVDTMAKWLLVKLNADIEQMQQALAQAEQPTTDKPVAKPPVNHKQSGQAAAVNDGIKTL